MLGLFFGRLPEDECRIPGKRKTRVCKDLTGFPQRHVPCSARMSFPPGHKPTLGGAGPRDWPLRVTVSPGDPRSAPELEPGIIFVGSIITQPADFPGAFSGKRVAVRRRLRTEGSGKPELIR